MDVYGKTCIIKLDDKDEIGQLINYLYLVLI